MKTLHPLILLTLLLTLTPPTSADPKEINCPKTTTPPTIDGQLTPQEWEDAHTLPIEFILSIEDPETKVEGHLYAKHDDTHLYIAIIHHHDPENQQPQKIIALEFDEQHNGMLDPGEEFVYGAFQQSPTTVTFHDYHWNGTTWEKDKNDSEIEAAALCQGNTTVWEFALPFDPDDPEDLDIQPQGDTGLALIFLDNWNAVTPDAWPEEGRQWITGQAWNEPKEYARLTFQTDTGGQEEPTTPEESDPATPGGIPGFPIESILIATIISAIALARARRT